jgi:hypothetical protein
MTASKIKKYNTIGLSMLNLSTEVLQFLILTTVENMALMSRGLWVY